MKFTTIRYGRLVSEPGAFGHEKLEAEVQLDDGEEPETVYDVLRDWVNRRVDPSVRRQEQQRLATQRQIEALRDQAARLQRDLENQGRVFRAGDTMTTAETVTFDGPQEDAGATKRPLSADDCPF